MGNATQWVLAGLVGLTTMGCGPDEGEMLYIMEERYEHDAQHDFGPMTGCTLAVYDDGTVGSSGLAGGLPGFEGDFIIEHFTKGQGLEVTIKSQDEVLATRNYDPAFARSGDVDTFQVTTQKGRVYDLAYWGGPTCDMDKHVINVPETDPDLAEGENLETAE